MAEYTIREYTDMLLTYGMARFNLVEAQRLYAERFPNRKLPAQQTFLRVVQRMYETGACYRQNVDAGAPRTRRSVAMEEEVLSLVDRDPNISVRKIARITNVSPWTAWKVLKDDNFYPYHAQKVQALHPADFGPRMDFCRWFLQHCEAQPDFPRHILFTDESMFTKEGMWNQHNFHTWSEINPHVIHCNNFQQKFRINVWAGILNGKIIGPYLLPHNLNSERYLIFLQEVLVELLEDVPLDIRKKMWYQQDGAPPHFGINVRRHLNHTYEEKWIGRGGPVQWPPRSPDLTPLDFFLWSHLKTLIYETPVDSEEDLIARLVMAVEETRTSGVVEHIYNNMLNRCRTCIQAGGRQFEQLLH